MKQSFQSSTLRYVIGFVLLGSVAIALMVATRSGSASTPSSGTLTAVSGPLTYTAGPFFVANATNNVNSNGEPTCSPAQTFPCDDYTLTVAVTDATKRVRVSVGWDVSTADFDLYVYDNTGTTLVTSSASSSDPEEVLLPASPGVYIIRTVPFAPAGQSYHGTINLEDIPVTPPPPPPGPGTPRFQIYNPDTAYNGGEPSIGTNWQTGNALYLASFDALRIGFDDCSSPAKDTWTNTNVPAAASLDPIGFTDHMRAPGDTTPNRTFISQLTGQDSITFFTDDDGATYTPSQGGGVPSGVDHQSIGAGPYNPSSSPAPPPHPTYPNAVYYCSQETATSFCARSDDGGLTFGPGVPVYNLAQCTGIHGHVKVAPDGTVYVPNRSCGGKAAAVVSKDNGITWAVKPIPTSSTTGFLVDPSIGIGTNNVGKPGGQASNTIYLGYQSADSHPRVAVSQDQGNTWVNDQDVGIPFGIVNSTFPELVAGDDNRAAYAFFGTTVPGNYTSFANYPQDAPWHLYIATTFDGGLSWTTVDATPNDPVQRGSICNLGTTACMNTPDDRNLLDFMDETIDAQGRTMVGYPDGCVGTCVTNPTGAHPNSYTAAASIARQSGGKPLFAAFDPNPAEPVVPKAPRVDSVNQSSPGTTVHLAWSEPDNGGSPLTSYKIYRKDGAAPYALLATITLGCPDCKTDYDDATATSTTTVYLYKVTATNAIGEGTNCNEFPVGSDGGGEEICVVPGLTKLTDGSGDTNASCVLNGVSTPAPPGSDLLSLQLAQPYAPDGVIKLVFTLNTDNGQSPQATGSSWYVAMRTPDSSCATAPCYKAVHMTWKAASPTVPVFESYVPGPAALGGVDGRFVDTVIGPAEASSSYNAPYNKVVIVVKASDLGLNAGDLINGFVAGVTQTSDAGGIGTGATCMFDPMPDSLAYTESYTVSTNQGCNTCPVAALSATSPTSGNAPLTVNFTGASSSDPDQGDSVATYTFNFGDNSPLVTQASPIISHTYNSAGDYGATLRVTDSRGLISCNTSRVDIHVTSPPPMPGQLQFSSSTYSVNENGGSATITVTRANGSDGAVSVQYATSNGTATSGQDYTSSSGTLSFANGETSKTFAVSVTDDPFDEPDETVNLTLSNATGGSTLGTPSTAVLTILDNDPLPSLSINDVSANEGNSGTTNFTFTVSLSAASGQSVTVNYATAPGTATAGSDYVSNSNTLTFNPGDTTKTITVLVNGDTADESNETFSVNLTNAQNATISDNQGAGTILNDDTPTIQFSQPTYTVGEGGKQVDTTVTRLGDISGAASVSFATSDAAGSQNCNVVNGAASERCDYETRLTTVNFAAGEASKTVSVFIIDDSYQEGPEAFTVTLSTPLGAFLGTPTTATVNITDNDSANGANPIDVTSFFVRLHYLDFLNREPDGPGGAFWSNNIDKCSDPSQRAPDRPTFEGCIDRQRETTSGAFFLSDEFQLTGYFVYLYYTGALGRVPTYREFVRDAQKVATGVVVNNQLSPTIMQQNRTAYAVEFTARSDFKGLYDGLTNRQYVDKLFQTTGIQVTENDKATLAASLDNASDTRATALHKVVESIAINSDGSRQFTTPYGSDFYLKQFNAGFVQMEYFGYLRRDPDASGYQHWKDKLDFYSTVRTGNYGTYLTAQQGEYIRAEMARSFIISDEYRRRFGP